MLKEKFLIQGHLTEQRLAEHLLAEHLFKFFIRLILKDRQSCTNMDMRKMSKISFNNLYHLITKLYYYYTKYKEKIMGFKV